MKGKKSEQSVVKWPSNPILNVVATMWQRLENAGKRRRHTVGN